ncbi:DgyrCDS3695 [Dimorphilus gyrociliatus]|uniref:DgyrCDS3695 n=1 Tax=Dimorphilus gyrociliatus TaxID=2664684 RepID=A0A7I8VHA1_9ANNE|nr:DgyrCDS3695 [Dimorphilus gyrociliatus]
MMSTKKEDLNSKSLDHLVSTEALLCKICCIPWVERDPRVLSCQHIFCFSCLLEMYGGRVSPTITCPSCGMDHFAENGVAKLPKSIIQDSISTISVEKSSCKKHNKERILPPIVCLTCKALNLCHDCIDKDHTNSLCKIVSEGKLLDQSKAIRQKFKNELENYRNTVKVDVAKIQSSLREVECKCRIIVDKSIADCNISIDDYEEAMTRNFKSIQDILNDVFIDDDQLFGRLVSDSVRKVNFEQNPSFAIDTKVYEELIKYTDKNNGLNILKKILNIFRKSNYNN